MNTRSLAAVKATIFCAVFCATPSLIFAQATTSGITARSQPDEITKFATPEAYWTPQRIQQAKPIPFYNEAADPRPRVTDQGEPLGPPTIVPGGKPGDPPKPAMVAPDQPSASDFSTDYGTQNIGDNDYVNYFNYLQLQYPWRTVGKLFITSPSGGSGWCTASVISPNNVIVTAAHCCYDRTAKAYNKNWTFAPAHRVNVSPYGLFSWSSVRVLTNWISSGGRQNDVCVIKLKPRSDGKTVSSLVGYLGRSWNLGAVQHQFAFGYPSNISSGLYKYECSAESYANCGNANVLAMGCNMTNGSSGGPWIRVFKKFRAGAMNYVNSVVSGYDTCTGTFGQSFNGARFTSLNIVPLCTAIGC